MDTPKPSPSKPDTTRWPGRIAWYTLVAIAVLLPLTTSITRGIIGGTYGFTDEVYHLPKLMLLAVLAAVATVAWIVDVALGGRPVRVGSTQYALGAFAALIAVSTAVAPERVSSLFGASGLMTGAVTWLLCIWYGWLVTQYLTASRVTELSWGLVAGSTGVALIGLLEAVGLDPLATPNGGGGYEILVRRAMSTTGNPDFTGLLLIVPIVVALALASAAKVDWARWIARGCAAVLGIALVVTLTRGAWIGALVAVVLFLVLATPDKRVLAKRVGAIAAVAAGAAVLALVGLGADTLLHRFGSTSKGLDALSSGRLGMWVDTLRAIALRPLFGTGADHLALGTYHVQKQLVIQGFQRLSLQDPHDLPLLIAGVFGIPALIAFTVLVVMLLRGSWRAIRGEGAPTGLRLLFTAWFAGIVGVLIASLLSVWTITAIFVLFLAVGVLMAPYSKPIRQSAVSYVMVAVSVVLVAAALYGSSLSFASSRQVALSTIDNPPIHLTDAMRLTPWDAGVRINYYWRKIQAMQPVLQGNDAEAAQAITAQTDSEIQQDIRRFPGELLLYRLRIDMYSAAKGYPGFEPAGLLSAVKDALAAFPGDPEFTQRLAQAESLQRQ